MFVFAQLCAFVGSNDQHHIDDDNVTERKEERERVRKRGVGRYTSEESAVGAQCANDTRLLDVV